MLGFFLFLFTVARVPHYPVIAAITLYALSTRRKSIENGYNKNKNFMINILLFLVFITFNSIIYGFITGNFQIPNFYLLPFCLICALSLNEQDIKIFFLCLAIECFFGFYEYSLGITTILPGGNLQEFSSDEMLYDKRAFGLSTNSSAFAAKLLFAFFVLIQFKDIVSKRIWIVLCLSFLGGMFVSFNRTIIVVFVFFIICIYFNKIKNLFKKNKLIAFSIVMVISFLFVYIITKEGSEIYRQFNRGSDEELYLSGRPIIWEAFFDFISNHLLMGNGSAHLLVPYYSGPIHAHNSFIQLIADHGIPLSIYFLIVIFSKVNRKNIIVCISIFIASMVQYEIFWGFSATDVFFYAFLLNSKFLNRKIVV